MKFLLAFNGSRGDVQPAIALGVELRRRGHAVTLMVPPNLTAFAAASGLPAHPYGLDTRSLLESELVTRDLKSVNPVTKLRAVSEITLRGGRQMQHELMDFSGDADAIIGGSAGQERAFNVAQVRNIPYIPIHLCPLRRNGEVSLLPGSRLPLPRSLVRTSWAVVEQILWRAGRSAEDTLAAELGLDKTTAPAATVIAGQGIPEIQAYDPVLFPGLAREWGAARPLVGFLGLDARTRAHMGAGEPSAEVGSTTDTDLLSWLDSGSAPLYVGFGSMAVSRPQRLMEIVEAVTEELDLRVLLATGWSDLESSQTGGRVFSTRAVDHDSVLPRCVGAVHHGGAGSTAASLRAGIPTAIGWLGADQPLWARQVTKAGVGRGFKLSTVTAGELRDVLSTILTTEHILTAKALAAAMVPPQDATASAATLVERSAAQR